MSTANTQTTLNGLFKKVYTNRGIQEVVPQVYKVLGEIDFVSKEKMGGESYNVPVALTLEHGVTYGGSSGSLFNLNAPVAHSVENASVKGNEIVLRAAYPLSLITRSMSSEAAFMSATKHLVQNLKESIMRKLEIEAFYGQMGLGKVDSVASTTITIQTAEFASGIWSGAKNMRVEIYDGTVKRGEAKIASVDLDARTITLDSMPTGTASGDDIYEFGAYSKEFSGIHKILTNTGSLFGISAAEYDLWKSSTYAVGGNLTLTSLQKGIARAIGRGLDEDVTLFVSPATFATMISDEAAFRKYDSSYKGGAENGFDTIKFHAAGILVSVVSHTVVKEGYAYALCMRDFEKVGSTDVTFEMPGEKDTYMKPLEGAHGVEIRCWADFALFCHKPSKQLLFTGITN